MSEGNYRYVVLGGGNAAGYVARSFAELGCQGMLRIVSEEKTLPYERSALSKDLLDRSSIDPKECEFLVSSQNEEWYARQNFDVRLNTRVQSVDLDQKILHTSSGDFSFEKLIIATGSSLHTVKIAGANLGEVHCLRWFDNRVKLLDAISRAKAQDKDEAKAVVIGSNYIATECAASIAEAGIETTLVLEADQFVPDLLPERLSQEFEELFRHEGVKVIRGRRVQEMLPRKDADDMVGYIRLSGDGGEQLECSFCVLIVPTMPRVELFRGALKIHKKSGGLLVDSHLRTSHRDVYAVGDVCAFPQYYSGKAGRWPRYDHAVRSAHYVAYSVLADEHGCDNKLEDYWYLPHTFSFVFHRSWDFFGRPLGECYTIGSLFDKQSGFAAVYVGPEKRAIEGLFLESGAENELKFLREVAKRRFTLTINQVETIRSMRRVQPFLEFLHELCDQQCARESDVAKKFQGRISELPPQEKWEQQKEWRERQYSMYGGEKPKQE